MLAWLVIFKADGPQSLLQIIAVQHHLRLIVGLRAGQPGIHVQVLRPGVVAAELQAFAQAVGHVDLQRVVAAVALGKPEKSAGQGKDWAGIRTGMYCAP